MKKLKYDPALWKSSIPERPKPKPDTLLRDVGLMLFTWVLMAAAIIAQEIHEVNQMVQEIMRHL